MRSKYIFNLHKTGYKANITMHRNVTQLASAANDEWIVGHLDNIDITPNEKETGLPNILRHSHFSKQYSNISSICFESEICYCYCSSDNSLCTLMSNNCNLFE